MTLPTPHIEKLNAALGNEKLPRSDVDRIKTAIERYHKWITELSRVMGKPDEVIKKSVDILNEYANFVYLELIFDSAEDFLYR
jgi:hypothetical protein